MARLANTVLREAMADDIGPGAILDVADLAAPSVVEALLGRTAHTIRSAGVDFVVSGATATEEGTLREIYGAWRRSRSSAATNLRHPGEVIACPGRDAAVASGRLDGHDRPPTN